jgi:ParB family chromosome partitioning protein
MPKFESPGTVKKINLAQIVETGNVRKDYDGIDELAATIKANGQLQPVLVKAHGKTGDGLDKFELVAGHRRIRAFRHLCENGDDFSRIDAIVVTGDKLTLQLIENLQRTDLTPHERETGIFEMSKQGNVSAKDVAAMLGKNERFIWRNLTAHNVRNLAAKNGIDTSNISTTTLCELSAALDDDIPRLLEYLKEEGGTTAAARRIRQEYRDKAESPPEPEAGTKDISTGFNKSDPDSSFSDDEFSDGVSPDIDVNPKQDGGDSEKQSIGKHLSEQRDHLPRETRTLANFDPQHKQVDMNNVLVIIKDYIDHIEESYTEPLLSYKRDAAWDIIALLHKRL